MNRALYRSLEVSQLLHNIRKKCAPKLGGSLNNTEVAAEHLLKDAQRLLVILQMIICKRIMDYRKFISKSGRLRRPNFVRQLTEAYYKNPGSIYMGSGMLSAEAMPFKQLSVTLEDNTEVKLTESELSSALQYGISRGYPPLVKRWRNLQKKWHTPLYHEWDVHITSGSLDACSKLFDLIIDESQPIMVQSPTHPAVLGSVMSKNPNFVPINMDDQGIIANEIDQFCSDRLLSEKSIPKLLYVNPTGADPIGLVYSTERKKEIYKLAQKYDFLILEDDPYYFLHYLDDQPVSFFSLDVDGRVLRLDSFSKIISPGLRLGTITGPRPLLAKFGLHTQSSTLHASSLSQVLVDKFLANFNDDANSYLTKLQKLYNNRRNMMQTAIEKHCSDITEWSIPNAGLFFWLRVTELNDVQDVVKKCIKKGILLVPGCEFYQDNLKPNQYMRLSFSHARLEDFDVSLSKLAAAIRHETTIKKK